MSRHLPNSSVPVAVFTEDVRRELAAARSPFLVVAGRPRGAGWHATVLATATGGVECAADVPAAGHEWRPGAVESALLRLGYATLPEPDWTVLTSGLRVTLAYAAGPLQND